MYIHSVKLINYKSIGDYDESEIILEPTITAIIGKNESGKSNVLAGLSEIDFIGNKVTPYSPEKINRGAVEGSCIRYEIVIKPSENDISNGITEDTYINLSKGNYELRGGLFKYFENTVRGSVDAFIAIITGLGSNPFQLRDQDFINYRDYVALLSNKENLNIPKFSYVLSYFHNKSGNVPKEHKEAFVNALTDVEDKIKKLLVLLPSFFFRKTDKHLKTTYKLDEVEKEIKPTTSSVGLLFDFVNIIGISPDEFISAVKSGSLPQQISIRNKINRLINERINEPFQEFYKTEPIYLGADFNTNTVSFTIQSENGAALLLNERSNGLRWYLETFIDAKARNIPGKNVIYLFDEPGTSLHVNAQKELLKLFKHLSEQGNQIVYTTHSPYMLNTENDGIHCIRAVVKDSNGNTKIYKTAYDARIAPNSQKDTLTPVINALGMNLNDTFGPAKDKINIVTEGMSDYIYICMMANLLELDKSKYTILPSVGASNCINICSILHGWGCRYIAVFDYDKAGVESGGEIMRKDMLCELGKQYCYLADVSQDEINSKTYKTSKILIEDIVTQEEIQRFCYETNTSTDIGKPLTAKLISNAVNSKVYKLGEECINNFKLLFGRICESEE